VSVIPAGRTLTVISNTAGGAWPVTRYLDAAAGFP
jgi:hypothetical protein